MFLFYKNKKFSNCNSLVILENNYFVLRSVLGIELIESEEG